MVLVVAKTLVLITVFVHGNTTVSPWAVKLSWLFLGDGAALQAEVSGVVLGDYRGKCPCGSCLNPLQVASLYM